MDRLLEMHYFRNARTFETVASVFQQMTVRLPGLVEVGANSASHVGVVGTLAASATGFVKLSLKVRRKQ